MVRNIKTLTLFLLFIYLFPSVSATSTGFETTKIDQELQERVWNNIELKVSKDIEVKDVFYSYHVNEAGDLAIGLRNRIVNVYDSDNRFLYSITFQGAGSYSIEWKENNLLLYLVRSDIAVEIDSSGNLITMREIITNSQHNNAYWNKLRDPTKIFNDNIYEMRNEHGFLNFFTMYYSKLVKTNADGKEFVIYDVSSKHRTTLIVSFVGVLLFTSIVTGTVLRYWTKLRQQSKK